MKLAQMLATTLPLLAGGCAMDRLVEVTAARTEVVSAKPNGLTSAQAADLFRDVAKQLDLVVEGPIRSFRGEYDYSALPRGARAVNKTSLLMTVNGKRVRFACKIYGTAKELAGAQRAAALFEESLDKLGIQYTVSTRRAIIPP